MEANRFFVNIISTKETYPNFGFPARTIQKLLNESANCTAHVLAAWFLPAKLHKTKHNPLILSAPNSRENCARKKTSINYNCKFEASSRGNSALFFPFFAGGNKTRAPATSATVFPNGLRERTFSSSSSGIRVSIVVQKPRPPIEWKLKFCVFIGAVALGYRLITHTKISRGVFVGKPIHLPHLHWMHCRRG